MAARPMGMETVAATRLAAGPAVAAMAAVRVPVALVAVDPAVALVVAGPVAALVVAVRVPVYLAAAMPALAAVAVLAAPTEGTVRVVVTVVVARAAAAVPETAVDLGVAMATAEKAMAKAPID